MMTLDRLRYAHLCLGWWVGERIVAPWLWWSSVGRVWVGCLRGWLSDFPTPSSAEAALASAVSARDDELRDVREAQAYSRGLRSTVPGWPPKTLS